MPRGQGGAVDAQSLGRAGTQIVDQDVGARRETFEIRFPRLAFQVQGHGLFVAVDHVERQRVAVPEIGAHAPRVVAALDALDFQHLGAEIAEDGAGERGRQNLTEFENPNSLKHGFPPGACRGIMPATAPGGKP